MRRKLLNKAELAFALLCEPGLLHALLTWPTFSVTSFLMLARVRRLGLRPGTIIDVGANIGQFATASAKVFTQAVIHSFEPVPECSAQLEKTAAKLPNVQVRPVALGDAEGELEFNVNSHSHSSSALSLSEEHMKAFPFAKEMGKILVQVSTLDREYDQKELRGPVLLKLDVQGYEANVLRGAPKTLPRIDYVLIELSFQALYLGENTFQGMLALLDSYGFEFQQPVGFLTDPVSGKYLQMDALFARRPA